MFSWFHDVCLLVTQYACAAGTVVEDTMAKQIAVPAEMYNELIVLGDGVSPSRVMRAAWDIIMDKAMLSEVLAHAKNYPRRQSSAPHEEPVRPEQVAGSSATVDEVSELVAFMAEHSGGKEFIARDAIDWLVESGRKDLIPSWATDPAKWLGRLLSAHRDRPYNGYVIKFVRQMRPAGYVWMIVPFVRSAMADMSSASVLLLDGEEYE